MEYHRSLAEDLIMENKKQRQEEEEERMNELREQKDLGREERNLCIFFNESFVQFQKV